jgi:hypothetical protein
VSLSENRVADFQRRAKDSGVLAAVVGSVVAGRPGTIEVSA